jgi:3D (Asp-Asp-Asp) domain-containing protein
LKKIIILILLSTIGVLTFSLSSHAQGLTREEVADAMDALRAGRMAQAQEVLKVSPYFSLAEGDTELLLLNRFGAPISVEISVHGERGGEWATAGTIVVDPRASTPFSLGSALRDTRLGFTSGSVAIRYQGDTDMVQAWAIAHHGDEVAEVSLEVPGRSGGLTLWDLDVFPARRDTRAELLLTNTGRNAAEVTVEITNVSGETITREQRIPPNGRVAVELDRGEGAGFATWRHDGGGSLVARPVVRSHNTLSTLPSWTPGGGEMSFEAPNVRLFSERVAHDSYGRDLTLLVLNQATETREVLVELVTLDGTTVYSEEFLLQPRALSDFDTAELLRAAQTKGVEFLRLRVTADGPGILPHGLVSDQGSNPVELAFFSNLDAHASGGYPIPDTSRYDVATTIVNVGGETSHVVGQVAWADGEWTVGPFVIEPRMAHRLAFDDLLNKKEADLLGRVPESTLTGAVFQWTVQAGGRQLIARTEARPRFSNDRFGFNCFGCCPELTWGELIPGSLTFPAGSSGTMEACQFISSCSFTVGPLRAIGPTLTYTAPLSWNGITASSQSPTDQVVRFTEQVQVQGLQCEPRNRTISDFGQIDVEGPEVRIISASLPNNQIRIELVGSQSLSGVLSVELRGTSVSRQIASAGRGAGTHTFSFGDLNSYTNGARYTEVFAQWNVNGMTPSDSFSYGIKVLGNYNHTRYNTVNNAHCPGSSSRALCFNHGATNSCSSVGSCSASSWSSVLAKPLFMTEFAENGSGFHPGAGTLSIEWFCGNPGLPGCSTSQQQRGRRVPSPCPTCTGMSVIPNRTVAVSRNHPQLRCGDEVFVAGVGSVQVTDEGGLVAQNQLDHYTGISGCNAAGGTIGVRKTFKLF